MSDSATTHPHVMRGTNVAPFVIGSARTEMILFESPARDKPISVFFPPGERLCGSDVAAIFNAAFGRPVCHCEEGRLVLQFLVPITAKGALLETFGLPEASRTDGAAPWA